MQKCKKLWNYEMTVVMEQDFDSPEEAANQHQASDKSKVKEVTNKRFMHSTVKLLKEDKTQMEYDPKKIKQLEDEVQKKLN
jgi:hypothetical protein